ncbi:MAG: PAS domain S-box protein [Bacteroidales bacterium]|nr:PAS domain S-box protein [Bacteroidales bacterium]
MFRFNEYNRPALKTAIYFFIFGFLWILLSDRFLNRMVSDVNLLKELQTYKGWMFICLTAVLIYLIVRKQIKVVVKLKDILQSSERRYKQIVELSHDVIWTVDANGLITFINRSSDPIYGFRPEEMVGRNFSEFIDKEQYEKNLKIFQENIKLGNSSVEYYTVFTNQKGEKVYLQDNVNALFDDQGQLLEIVGASKNITKDKLYEMELLENKERLEIALQGGHLGLWDYDIITQNVFVNETWCEMIGLSENVDRYTAEQYGELFHPDDISALEDSIKLFLSGEPGHLIIEHRLRHQNGSWKWILSKGKVAEWDENKKPLRFIGTSQDITARKQLELDLKYWLDVYSSFIKYANEGIFLHEIEKPIDENTSVEEQIDILFNHGYIKTCNDSFAAMYGYNHAYEMEGFTLAQLQGGDDNPHNIEFLRKFIHSGYRLNNELSLDRDINGHQLYISNNLVGIHENSRLVRIWGSQYNITEQVLAQKKLENSEKRYRLLFETNPVPLIIFDLGSCNIYDVNSAAEKLFECSRTDLLKLSIQDIRPDLLMYSLDELQALLKSELSTTTELTLLINGKRKIQAEVRTDMIEYESKKAVIAAVNDITLLREAEKMVIRSLIEGEDRERKRVAKEIHDGLGQNLTAASLNFGAIKNAIERLDEAKRDQFRIGYSFLNNAIEESRNIALNLMPKAIDDFGLVPSLKSLFSQIEKSGGLKITFYENLRNDVRLPRNVELNLYRITQEALNNTLKHAGATHIFIQLLLHTKEIIYTFEDDGKGFDLRKNAKESKGMGIKNINNRAMAMSGIFEMDSTPGKGTALTIQIPL